MGWDRHKLLWDGNGTDKYGPWTTLRIHRLAMYHINEKFQMCYKNKLRP